MRTFKGLTISFLFLNFVLLANPGKIADDFTLADFNGKEYSLSQFTDSKAVVIMFVSTRCPVSNAYNERMENLSKKYSSEGITFLGINSNKAEDNDEIKSHAEENEFSFVILKDNANVIADRFEAKYTPEIFVLNGSRELLYHGRIDDSRKADDVETEDLARTLNEILEGKEVSVKETKAFGCTIKRVEK